MIACTAGPDRRRPAMPTSGRCNRAGTGLRQHPATVLAVAALLAVFGPGRAAAQCSCPAGGIPLLDVAKMTGNDLAELRGHCAMPHSTVELQVYQQHLKRAEVCPPRCPTSSNWGECINGCRWVTIASTTADGLGWFRFAGLDDSHSVQLVSGLPDNSGRDGVYTALRVRTWDAAANRWTAWTNPPFLEGFNVAWSRKEGAFALLETRVSGADQVQVAVADGPDDGDEPAIALDVDEDTPNFFLAGHPGGTVEYTRYGVCDTDQGCPAQWLVAQSPSVTVQAPPLSRGSEYPWVLGMVTASKPGALLIGTTAVGPRSIADIEIDVNIDIDLDIGLDFSSIF